VSTLTTILLPLHIAAINGVSHEKPAAEGLVNSREHEEHLQSLKEMEISLEDTAVGMKKIVLEQQLNAATLSIGGRERRRRGGGEVGVRPDRVVVRWRGRAPRPLRRPHEGRWARRRRRRRRIR